MGQWTPSSPETTVNVLLYLAGELEALPDLWETLCSDIRQLILSKLSLRELASIAPACRDFHGKFLRRTAEERARLVSVGEDTYGKERFSGLVRAFQQFMLSWEPYPDLRFGKNCLVINASGEVELVTKEEAGKRHAADGRLLCISRSVGGKTKCKYHFDVELLQQLPGSGKAADVSIHAMKSRKGKRMVLKVVVHEEVVEEAMGFLVALCTTFPTDQPCPSTAITLQFPGMWGAPAKRQLEDLVEPFRLPAESYEWYRDMCSEPHPFAIKDAEQAPPLGHLQLIWYDKRRKLIMRSLRERHNYYHQA
jgi:hypothetical protein